MRYLPSGLPDPSSHVGHAAVGIGRLTSPYRDQPKLAAAVGALLNACQGAEDVLWQFFTQRFFPWPSCPATVPGQIVYAQGVQLDTWGQVVGEPRAELVYDHTDPFDAADVVYTTRIQIRVLVNSSSGTWAELLTIATLASGTADITMAALPPARVIVFVNQPFAVAPGTPVPISTPDILDGWLLAAAAGGVAVTLAYVPTVSPQLVGLEWSSVPGDGTTAGRGGWSSVPGDGTTVGGCWYGMR